MPRYFFDTDNGDHHQGDETGVELPDIEAARRLAQATLPDMAHDSLPDGERRDFTVSVRGEDGALLYSTKLELTEKWYR